MISRISLIAFFLVILPINLFCSWPVNNVDQQNNVISIIGDYRANGTRFHRGFDIVSSNENDFNVYAMQPGAITYCNWWNGNTPSAQDAQLTQGNIVYLHIEPVESIKNAVIQNITQEMINAAGGAYLLGTMMFVQGPLHIHIQGDNQNFLADATISPFADNTNPIIYENRIFRNGHTLQNYGTELTQTETIDEVDYTKVWDKIDLVTRVEDTQTNATGNDPGGNVHVSPYMISFQLFKEWDDTEIISNWEAADNITENIVWNDYGENAASGSVFGYGSHFQCPFYWNLTSHPRITPYDRYLNTLRRINTDEEWTQSPEFDARCVDDSRYPDGLYRLKFWAYDIDNSGMNESEDDDDEIADTIHDILIDNFVPYIKEVKIKSNSSTVYRAGWNWWDNIGLVYAEQASSFCRSGIDITIEVTASEPMDTLYISSIEPFGLGPTAKESVSEDRTNWVFRIPASLIPEYEKDGNHLITIDGKDLSGNSLEILDTENSPYLPETIPLRKSMDNFDPNPQPGADTNYSFSINSSYSGMSYNNIIDGIQSEANFTPNFEGNKRYILTNVTSLHPDFNLVAWGHSNNIDTSYLELDQNFIQPYHSNAYKNMTLEINQEAFPITSSTGRYIFFEGDCPASSGDYRIYDPIDKEIINIGIADTVYNASENSFVRFSDVYQYSGHWLSNLETKARYTLTVSDETHDIKRHSDYNYIYDSGEWFFSDVPQWNVGEYILKKKYPVVDNDIVSFDSMDENPDSGWHNSVWCATEGWNNISGSSERGDLDNIVVYNLADYRDYRYNGANWEQVLYPEIKLSHENISYFLVQSDIFNDQFSIVNDGDGVLDYRISIVANAETTYVDEEAGTSSDFDVIDLQCGIGSEGFYANMGTSGYSPMGVLFIDSDQDSTTGISWYNDGVNSPLGSSRKSDKEEIISDIAKFSEISFKTPKNNSIGIDYVILLDMVADEITVINATTGTSSLYNSIWFSANSLEFSFPIASLLSDGISSDGNCSFFFNFISNENGQVCEFAPTTGHISMGESLEWIDPFEIQGQIAADQSQGFNLNIDPSGMSSGNYEATIFIGSNDIIYPWVNIPVNLDLESENNICVSKGLLHFGNTIFYQTKTESFYIINHGNLGIDVDDISTDNSDFAFEVETYAIAAGDSAEVIVSFSPSTVGIISGELMITANNQLFTVIIRGTGEDLIVLPPTNIDIEVSNNDVILSWDAPAENRLTSRFGSLRNKDALVKSCESRTFLSYNIYRNAVLIGQTEELTFTDYNVPDSIFTYSVTVLYSDDIESEPIIASPVSFAPTITNLMVDQYGLATWEAPVPNPEVLSGNLSKRDRYSLIKIKSDKPRFKANKESSGFRDMGIIGYNVYLDGNLVGFTTELLYDFDSGNLYYDELYSAEVSVVYDSGESSKECYMFCYSLLNSPDNLSVIISDENVILSWDNVPGIAHYRVYSSDSPSSDFSEDITGTYTQSGWIAPIMSSKSFYFVKSVKEE
ncbi:MAG: hypothetical protein R6U84_04525 [Candidatus Cloacimonadales bacterium]